MNKALGIAVLTAAIAIACQGACAEDNPTPATQPAGGAGVTEKIKEDAQATGDAIKRDAKSVGDAAKRDAKAAGDAAKHDAKIVADKTKTEAKAAGEAAKKVAKQAADATKTEVDKLKKSPPETPAPTENK